MLPDSNTERPESRSSHEDDSCIKRNSLLSRQISEEYTKCREGLYAYLMLLKPKLADLSKLTLVQSCLVGALYRSEVTVSKSSVQFC